MSVTPGTRFGTYEVGESLGSGGMGEVYRARDSRLRRDVALKVLPARHRLDSDRQARFEREALTLAALNHPNIATVYGVETANGVQALVMELVDGPTLADRIDSGAIATPGSAARERSGQDSTGDRNTRGLPVAEAIGIARQIVDALEAAHERDVIHRDLKPSNIKIRLDGVVKILDFGLAKALETAVADVSAPTVTLTSPHTVMGTPAYMSPEQARGQDVDQRTDIWAFGCVLYEMLTGQRAFEGSTSSDTIASVLDREPDYERLPKDTPPLVLRLVKRCLTKEARRRLRDIADARLDLDDAANMPTSTTAGGLASPRPRLARVWVAMGVVTLVAAIGIATAPLWLWRRGESPARPVHMTVLLPPGVTVTRGPGRILSLALSPDGRTLVVAGTDGNNERLYIRTLDRPEATPLAGTEGGTSPFFSPDGAWVGFFADRRLKRVPVAGGAALDIAAAPGFPAGASWGKDDRIVFAGYQAPIQVVDSRGGTQADLLPRGPGVGHLFPEVLPDGRTVLFTEGSWTHAFDMVRKRRMDRIIQGVGARYSPDGYLLVTRGTTLLAAAFDPTNLQVSGPVLPIVERVDIDRRAAPGSAHVTISREGTVAFVPGATTFALVVIEQDGTERVVSEHTLLENPRFSPDGQRLVVAATRNPGEPADLWVYDLKSGSPGHRLTFDGGRAPVWSRNGESVTYSYPVPGEQWGIYSKAADGRGHARRVVALSTFHWLVGWTPEQTLVYGMMEPTPGDRSPASSILAFDGTASRRLVGPGRTWGGRLSPDGRWLAYYASESGYFEIYVTPVPQTGSKSLIAEGTDPAWSPDGSEIYYRSGSRLMAARVGTSSGVRVLSRRLVHEPFNPPLYDDYDIHPDGKTLVLVQPPGALRGREISLLLNWPAELGRFKPQ